MLHSIQSPAFEARNLMIGTLSNIVFGTLWLIIGLNASQSMQRLFLFPVLAIVALILLAACLRLLWTVSCFPLHMPAGEVRRKGRMVNLVTLIEFVGSTLAAFLLGLAGRNELVLPMIVTSVGLYLLALASILRLTHYALVGTLLCLLPSGIILLVPAVIPLAGAGVSPDTGRLVLIGLIGGGIQLALALFNLRLTLTLRRRLRGEETLEATARG
jgi:hypothetical protein